MCAATCPSSHFRDPCVCVSVCPGHSFAASQSCELEEDQQPNPWDWDAATTWDHSWLGMLAGELDPRSGRLNGSLNTPDKQSYDSVGFREKK